MTGRTGRGATRLLAAALAFLTGCAGLPSIPGAPRPARGPEYRIYSRSGAPLGGVEALADSLGRYDVVFFGEDHDDPHAHRLEAELLDALARRGRPVTVGLEMFERDVQPALDAYLAGTLSDSAFRASSRPWSNYAADYRPLVETARRQGWRVIASNAPRPLAALVSTAGLEGLSALEPTNRAYVAAQIDCPQDDYYRRFLEAMRDEAHPTAQVGTDPRLHATLLRYYQAQCVKDETMAESITAALRPGTLVVHFNGAFHSDHALGTVSRLQHRAPAARVAVVTAIPVRDTRRLTAADPVADYVVLTRADSVTASAGR